MPLTWNEKVHLMRAYEPILHFHHQEKFTPVSPGEVIKRSGIWDDDEPIHDAQVNWGEPDPVLNGVRRPILKPGQLTVFPEEAAETGQRFLGEQAADGTFSLLEADGRRELFLDHHGWLEVDEAPSLNSDTPDRGFVGPHTRNRMCDLQDMQSGWQLPERANATRWYCAEVHDEFSLMNTLGGLGEDPSAVRLRVLTEDEGFWFVWYHFFYPAHLEKMRLDALVAQLLMLGIELPADPGAREAFVDLMRAMLLLDGWPPFEFSAIGGHSVPDEYKGLFNANYAGDWNSICLVIPRTDQSPLEIPTEELPSPRHVAFGKRFRGASPQGPDAPHLDSPIAVQMMPIAENVQLVEGRHVKVFVSNGTHNNYPTPGVKPPPWTDSPVPLYEEVQAIDYDNDLPVDDPHHIRRHVLISLAKVLGGIAVGGWLGGLIGGTAALLEGLRDSGPHPDQDPDFDPDNVLDPDYPDQAPEEDHVGLILAPEALVETLTEEMGESATEVLAWQVHIPHQIRTNLVTAEQIWWPPGVGSNNGYRGRFGVAVAEDPLNMRNGMTFPPVHKELVETLWENRG